MYLSLGIKDTAYAISGHRAKIPIRFGKLALRRIRFAGGLSVFKQTLTAFPDRLMAGQHSLEVLIVVRIHVREQGLNSKLEM